MVMRRPLNHRVEQNPVMDRNTLILPSVQNGKSELRPKWLQILPMPLQLLMTKLLERVSDPEPEIYAQNRQYPMKTQIGSLGWLPLLTFISALGILLVAYAFANSRDGGAADSFFYSGLLLIFVPTVVRLISPTTVRTERIGLVCLVGVSCYLIKVISSPLYFSLYDEFLHWRTADDIARSGHLFTENALLPVSPYYPGLEVVTNAFSTLSGLDIFTSGLIVIGVARLLMSLALFAMCETIVKSSRIAGLAVIIYMANSHFLIFDAQYGYESLALPLAVFVMFALAPHQMIFVRLTRLKPLSSFMKFAGESSRGLSSDLRGMTLMAWIVLAALLITHHVTDFFLDGLLLVWAIVYTLMGLAPIFRSNLAKMALLGACLSLAYALYPGNPVVNYLSSFMAHSIEELIGVITGSGSARQLFVTYTGQPTPLWQRLITISSVGLTTFCLPFGMLCLWKSYRFNALTCTFGVISFLYPVSQVFRFTTSGAELADRAAPFLFIAISVSLAIFMVQFWPIRRLNWKHTTLLTCGVTLIFVGGVILGIGPGSAILPGPYEVIADQRSIEPEGIQAAIWSGSHLGDNNRTATDRINQILMGTYGSQRIVTSIEDKIDLSPVFLSPSLGTQEVGFLRHADVRYLVVDLRLAHSLPLEGYYYDQGEVDAFKHTTPVDLKALSKFNNVPQINRLFDSGDIVIYDVGGLINAPETS